MDVLQEVTEWVDCVVPNHTYHVNRAGKLVAYIIEGTDELIVLKTPLTFDKSKRKFKKLAVIEEAVDKNTIQVEGSNGKIYNVVPGKSCTCSGFTFRGKCKHMKVAA